jgi:hypothetical protein
MTDQLLLESKPCRRRSANSMRALRCGPCSALGRALIVATWHVQLVFAADTSPSILSLDGFGTAGVVHSSDTQADFTSTAFKPNGAGSSHNWSVDVDSRFGAQLSANFSPQLSAVVQLIAEQGYDNTYTPTVEWANVKYQFTPNFSLRLGRIELPTFLVSDFRKVGYAIPWVRPPVEVYGVAPLTNNDGMDVSYRLNLGEFTNTLRAAYGRSYKLDFPSNVGIDTRDLSGIFDSVEYRAAVFHASYLQTHAQQNPANPLFVALREFGPQGVALAGKYELQNRLVKILAFGASYDPGDWFAMSEWTRLTSDSFLGSNTAWYVSAGYRMGKFTPYLTSSQITAPTMRDSGLPVSAFPPQLAGTIMALDDGLDEALESTRHVQCS